MGDGPVQALDASAFSKSTAAANTAVVITLPATAGKYWLIPGLIYSYDELPSVVGGITISDGANGLDWDEVSNGSYARPFFPPWRGALGAEVVVTLKAGGAGVIGKLNIVPAPYLQG